MSASEARIRANQQNSQRSTGPKTEEGKARSRANSLKHGLTGEGIVVPQAHLAEVERLSAALADELKVEGEVGHALARRMAVMSTRMDRSVDQESAQLAKRVRQALDEFEAPAGVTPLEADKLRAEAGRIALFDPSKEASLARKYEAAAERCFFRALKELRQLKQQPAAASSPAEVAAETRASIARLGSFLPASVTAPSKPSPVAPKPAPTTPQPSSPPTKANLADWDLVHSTNYDLPIAIGRSR